MGGMSSTTTSTPKMPGYVEGLYKDIYKDIGSFYDKGKMPVYGGPTNAGLTLAQKSALGFNKDGTSSGGGMLGVANANSNGQGMSGNLQQIMSNGGFNPEQLQAMAGLNDLKNNAGMNQLINDPNGMTQAQNQAYSGLQSTVYGNNAQMQDLFNNGGLTADQQAVADKYRTQMNSTFDLNSNPAYAQVRQNALDAGAQGVNALAAKAGRFGGGANQNILARAQSDTAANLDLGEYRNWQQRGDQAASNLAGLSQTGVGNQQNINAAQQAGLQNIGNMGAMGVDQRSNAINQKSGIESSLFNMGQAGLSNMGQAYDTAMKPYQTQMGAGNILQQQKQNVINDKIRKFDAQNPMNAYQQFLGLASGMPTGTTQTTNPSTLQMLLGGGISGLGLLGGMGMFGGGTPSAGAGGL